MVLVVAQLLNKLLVADYEVLLVEPPLQIAAMPETVRVVSVELDETVKLFLTAELGLIIEVIILKKYVNKLETDNVLLLEIAKPKLLFIRLLSCYLV